MEKKVQRTLIIRKPLLNNFERYKIDPTFAIDNIEKMPAFHQFMSKNPLPYYLGEPRVEGGSFWSDFADGFKKGFTTTLDIGSKILPLVGLGDEMMPKVKRSRKKKVVKEESSSEEEEEMHEMEHKKHELSEQKKLTKIEHLAKDMKKQNKKMLRGELVRKLMKEKGMTLGQASKHIKQNNLI